MRAQIFTSLPDCAKEIRVRVFMDEQGFQNEFDDLDNACTHIVLFDSALPVATCRIWQENGEWHVGRLAVIKACRGQGLGQNMLAQAEAYVRKRGADRLCLHAQCRAEPFYRKCGYTPYGEIDYDEGVEHIHMEKFLN